LVLRDSARAAALLAPRDTPGLILAGQNAGVLSQDQALTNAHAVLLAAGLECTLDRRPRRVVETDAIALARRTISAAMRERGLRPPPP
jgi:glutamate-ammonia-ligase adenylyltransferase